MYASALRLALPSQSLPQSSRLSVRSVAPCRMRHSTGSADVRLHNTEAGLQEVDLHGIGHGYLIDIPGTNDCRERERAVATRTGTGGTRDACEDHSANSRQWSRPPGSGHRAHLPQSQRLGSVKFRESEELRRCNLAPTVIMNSIGQRERERERARHGDPPGPSFHTHP